MRIRRVRDEDYEEIARLRTQTIFHVNAKDYPEEVIDNWAFTISAQNLRESDDSCKRWVALENDMIIGFCEHTFKGEISRIYVHKDHLRKSVGSQLLEVAENSLKKMDC